MNSFFRKMSLFAVVLAIALAALPSAAASAAGADDPPAPPQKHISNERLERVWARQLRIYERLGRAFSREDPFRARAQHLIDRAKENGKDVSAVQAALDAFEAALKEAHPVYESARGIVSSPQGFDENGLVTDPVKAQETVTAMREKLAEIRDALGGTGRALQEAIRAFREANPPPQTAPAHS